MKKRLLSLLLVLVMALCSTGCSLSEVMNLLEGITGTPSAEQTTTPSETTAAGETTAAVETTTTVTETTTAAPEPVLNPVEEDVFFFANELEYSRLYSMHHDGTGLKLILDEQVRSVQQQGERVYFIDALSRLCFYNIPTGERKVALDKAIGDYRTEGQSLVYTTPTLQEDGTSSFFVMDLIHRNTETGDEFKLTTLEATNFYFGQGVVYYTRFDIDAGGVALIAYHLAQREARVIHIGQNGATEIFPVNGGVYFTEYDSEEETSFWYFVDHNGSALTRLDSIIPTSATLLQVSEKGFLYRKFSDYVNRTPGGVYFMSSDGQVTELISGQDYYQPIALPNGHYLFTSAEYLGWGEQNEFGGYENYYPDYEYILLLPDNTVRTLSIGDTTAELFKGGDFPLLDSSTARKPITAALYSLFVKSHGYEGKAPICSTTHGAWVNIADRKVDMALLAAPTEEEQAYLKEKGVEIEMKLYGGDGLVFIGNAANPVTNLTHEQILAIYRGEITNWKEVGGPDHKITVFYRDDQSGSQRLFENLVFKGLELPDFEGLNFEIMDDMSSIVNICLADPYAIGYSIMTYLQDVYANEGLQVFSVNGAAPSAETVKDKSYPYNTQGYLVIRSDEPADSPARRLFNWFGTAMSDDILYNNSVTPLHDDIVDPTTE